MKSTSKVKIKDDKALIQSDCILSHARTLLAIYELYYIRTWQSIHKICAMQSARVAK